MSPAELVDDFLKDYFADLDLPRAKALAELKVSIEYSLFSGGKRFRPSLCLFFAETFAVHPKALLPWATAIEMIHTYSLIHDDLPCMDDDDLRRGQPSNHKKFSESTALLAGDALLTEAFAVIAKFYSSYPNVVVKLVGLLTEASGILGMVGGQMMDLSLSGDPGIQEVNLIHQLKTGALIRAACEGSAVVMGMPEEKQKLARQFGENLGLAFQIKDDLLDQDGLVKVLGQDQVQQYLQEISQNALSALSKMEISAGPLLHIVDLNQKRTH